MDRLRYIEEEIAKKKGFKREERVLSQLVPMETKYHKQRLGVV